MAWQTPKISWVNGDVVSAADMNRIEGNIAELKKAANIDIQDTAGNFTATNVEDALQELAASVKNGKNAIANAITAMGQTASGDDTFATLASKIRDISKDADATPADVAAGKTFYAGGIKQTGTMPPFEVSIIAHQKLDVYIEGGGERYVNISYPASKTVLFVVVDSSYILYSILSPPLGRAPYIPNPIMPMTQIHFYSMGDDYITLKLIAFDSAIFWEDIYIVGY